MTAALLTSLLLALTFTPALSLSLLRSRKDQSEPDQPDAPFMADSGHEWEPQPPAAADHEHKNGPIMQRVLNVHTRALSWTIGRPWAIAVIAVVLLTSGYFAYPPASAPTSCPRWTKAPSSWDCTMPAGSSLEATRRRPGRRSTRILRRHPRSRLSPPSAPASSSASPPSQNPTTATTPSASRSNRKRPIRRDQSTTSASRVKEAVPMLDVEYTQVLEDMIGDLSNTPEPIQVKLFYHRRDRTCIHELGPKVQAAIKAASPASSTPRTASTTRSQRPRHHVPGRPLRRQPPRLHTPRRSPKTPPRSSTVCPPTTP